VLAQPPSKAEMQNNKIRYFMARPHMFWFRNLSMLSTAEIDLELIS